MAGMITTAVANKAGYFAKLVSLVSDVDGSIVEIGVGAAKSAKYICKACIAQGRIREYWGFDSFKGFPSPSQEDEGSTKDGVQEGYFAAHWCSSPLTARERIVAYSGYPPDNLHFVKGFYSRTLFQGGFDGSGLALLHLDCDLFHSYRVALDFFCPFLAEGGIVAFDEYRDSKNLKEWPGAAKAIDQWLERISVPMGDLREYTWHAADGRIVHKYCLVW